MATHSAHHVLDFLTLIHNLKNTERTGWVRHGVNQPESISDHMYMMSMMAWLASPQVDGLDKEKCIKIALVHDMAECIVGDITPSDNISKEEKAKREAEAMNQLRKALGETSTIADEFVALWSEYENASTPEAVLVKQIDKLEMVIQAFIYEQRQEIDLSEFYESVRTKITNPVLRSWLIELAERRLQKLPHLTPVKTGSNATSSE